MVMHALLAIALATPAAVSRSAALQQRAPTIAVANAVANTAPAHPAARPGPRKRTTFGAAIAPVSEAIRAMPYLAADEGVVLTAVAPGSAADAAGLRAGDLVLAVSGKHVDETTLYGALRAEPRQHAFRVEFLREGKWKDTWVTIEE
jgi:putative serine protease PepD